MICHAGIVLLTDELGTPVQVHIDLVRHGRELASFLRAHGLVETLVEQAADGFTAPASDLSSPAAAQGNAGSLAAVSAAIVKPARHTDDRSTSTSPVAAPAFRLILCDELAGAVPGSGLTPLYRPPKDTLHIAVVYRPEVKAPLNRAVEDTLSGRTSRRAPAGADAYTAQLLAALERSLRSRRRGKHEPASDKYARYGHDMFCFRFRLRESRNTLWIACYTLHETTILVRYIGAETSAKRNRL